MYADGFIRHITAEKQYSTHTITAYKTDLIQFFDFTATTYKIDKINEIDYQVVRSWLAHLLQNKVSARAVNRKLSTLKSYFKYLVKNDLIQKNPMQKVIAPKTSNKLPVFIETAKINQLLDSDVFTDDFTGTRNRIVIEILYATGMRVSELTALMHKHIDIDSMVLLITGKRNKQRLIPFGSNLSQLIKDYVSIKEKSFGAANANDYFIITDKGEKAYARLIYNIVNSNLQMVTTQLKKSPHILRHSFATSMLNNGADLNSIKELLGHANLAATQVYTHNTIERIKRIYHQTHPKA